MLKISELEKKWYRYRVKKTLIPLIISLLLIASMGAGYYFLKDTTLSSLNEKITELLGMNREANLTKEIEIEKEPIVKEPVEEVNVEKKEPIELEPIIPVIDLEKEEKIKHPKKSQYKKHVKKSIKNSVKAKPNTYLTKSELSKINSVDKRVESKPHVMKKMKFTSTSSNYLQTIMDKFSKSSNPRDALLLAKTFYNKGNYVESEKWALKANKLDSSLEESWYLFAKSKAKLGQKREALKILVSYYNKDHSSKTKELIGKIKTGRI